MSRLHKFSAILLALVLLSSSLSGCFFKTAKPDESSSESIGTQGNTGEITTGKTVSVSKTKVTPEGDIITVDKSGSPLNGFELTVPPDSYSDDLSFKISYAPITKQTFGDAINPVSPLISIDNGGEYSEEPMYVKVPVKVPEGYFAMGFYYDDDTGKIEGMPLVAFDDKSVTVCTRHFSDIFISMIQEKLLEKDIDTGFRPGVDDWEFANVGSCVAPGGHCLGQSIAALWYYCFKPDGKNTALYGQYDNNGNKPSTPDLWQDDSLGYRLCSAVHDNGNIAFEDNLLAIAGKVYVKVGGKWKIKDIPGIGDQAAWFLFAYSMLATGMPQMVGIFNDAANAHAMICYQIYKGNLYIADPNYPGNTDRSISYADGSFSPYSSGANRAAIDAGDGTTYDKIVYYANWSMLKNDYVSKCWADLKSGSVGNDVFPSYDLFYVDEKGADQPLTDGVAVSSKKLKIALTTTDSADFACNVWRDGAWLTADTDGNFDLKPGNNLLGINIVKLVDNAYQYVDFKYINVVYSGLAITPDPLEGEVGKEYTFTAAYEVTPPDGLTYNWYVNNEPKQSSSDSTFKTTFDQEGSYTVSVEADESGADWGKDEAKVTINAAVTMTISPDIMTGDTGVSYPFSISLENAPSGVMEYDWYINGILQETNIDSIDISFPKDGYYVVTAHTFVNGKEVAKSESDVTINKSTTTPSPSPAANNLAALQQNGFFEASINIRALVHKLDTNSDPSEFDKEDNVYFWALATPIVWDGVNFSGTRVDTIMGAAANQTIAGTVSTDGNTVLNVTCQLQVDATDQKTSVTMVMQNIPLKYLNGDLYNEALTSLNVQKYIVTLEYNVTNYYMGSIYASTTYISPVWTNESSLQVVFRKTQNP